MDSHCRFDPCRYLFAIQHPQGEHVMSLEAKVVQQLLTVADMDTVAYGYTFDRKTVTVWFEDGKVCRSDVHSGRLSEAQYEECVKRYDTFDGETILHAGIKRWYADKTVPALREWCKTFGRPLTETSR